MYVETVPNRNSPPAILLREAWRERSRIRKRTLANLSKWPPAQIQALQAVLKGNYADIAPTAGLTIERTRPHGHVAAVLGTVRRLKLDLELTRFRRRCWGRRERENPNAINPSTICAGIPAANHRTGTSWSQHQRAGARV
jgi:hypothetical protein